MRTQDPTSHARRGADDKQYLPIRDITGHIRNVLPKNELWGYGQRLANGEQLSFVE